MRIALVIVGWAVVSFWLLGFHALGAPAIALAPLAVLALAIGVLILRLPERERVGGETPGSSSRGVTFAIRVFSPAHGLLFMLGLVGFFLLGYELAIHQVMNFSGPALPDRLAEPTEQDRADRLVVLTLVCLASVGTAISLRVRKARAIVAGMWAAVFLAWATVLWR